MTRKAVLRANDVRSADVVQIAKQYPLLWERAVTADTRERLGQTVDPLDAECDAVLREVWTARANLLNASCADTDYEWDCDCVCPKEELSDQCGWPECGCACATDCKGCALLAGVSAWPKGGLPHGEHPYDYGDESDDERASSGLYARCDGCSCWLPHDHVGTVCDACESAGHASSEMLA